MSLPISVDSIMNHMSDLVFIMSVDDSNELRYAKMNLAAMNVSGLNEHAYGATFHDMVEPLEADFLHSQYTKAVLLRRPISFVHSHNGHIGESVLNPIYRPDGTISHVVGVVRDITQRYHREQQFKQQALQDPLTGLLNRRGLEHNLENVLQDSRRAASLISLFVIDVDQLKQVNDKYGHITGDLYLRNIADRLRLAIREEDIICRFGGDEFLIAAHIVNETDTVALAERILAAFTEPWLFQDMVWEMSVSIGVATYPVDGLTLWDMIRTADEAMYRAKQEGGKRYVIVG